MDGGRDRGALHACREIIKRVLMGCADLSWRGAFCYRRFMTCLSKLNGWLL
jgi:hypothetical protein